MFFHDYSLAVKKTLFGWKKICQKNYVNLQTKFLTVYYTHRLIVDSSVFMFMFSSAQEILTMAKKIDL